MTPEQKARIEIDKKLIASGWFLQDKRENRTWGRFYCPNSPSFLICHCTIQNNHSFLFLFFDQSRGIAVTRGVPRAKSN